LHIPTTVPSVEIKDGVKPIASWAVECDVSFSTIGPARIVVFSDINKLFFVITCLFFILRVEVFDKQFCFLFTYIVTFCHFFHRDIYVIHTFVCRVLKSKNG
jgi:hypothetical protein